MQRSKHKRIKTDPSFHPRVARISKLYFRKPSSLWTSDKQLAFFFFLSVNLSHKFGTNLTGHHAFFLATLNPPLPYKKQMPTSIVVNVGVNLRREIAIINIDFRDFQLDYSWSYVKWYKLQGDRMYKEKKRFFVFFLKSFIMHDIYQ